MSYHSSTWKAKKPSMWRHYTRFAWAGGTFFHVQLCCCVSFLFQREIGCGFTYYLCTQSTIQLWCCVQFFLILAGNSFRCFVRMVLIVQYSCVVVSVFGSGRKHTLLLYTSLLALTDRQMDSDSNTLALRGLEEPFFISSCAVESVFPPNLSCPQNNPPKNNVEPVPAKSELPPKQSPGK